MKENFTYLLIETSDEMQNTVAQIDNIIDEQRSLVNIIESNENSKKFKAFIDAMNNETTMALRQRNVLLFRNECLKKVIEKCQSNDDIADAITLFCKAFNVFDTFKNEENEENENTEKSNKIIDLPIK